MASHTIHTKCSRIEKDYAAALTKLAHRENRGSKVRMISSVTGQDLDLDAAPLDGPYWVANLLSPVLFSQAVSRLCHQQYEGRPIDTIVEIGPHSQLAGPISQILKKLGRRAADMTYIPTLQRGKDAEVSLLRCLGSLHVQNVPVRLFDLNHGKWAHGAPSLLVDLPPYPFDHDRRFWHESRMSKSYRHRPHLPRELLGTLSMEGIGEEPRWRRFLSLKESPWLRHHVIQDQIVFPAAGYITMAIQAMRQHTKFLKSTAQLKNIVFRNISISKALVLSDDTTDLEIVLTLRPQARSARESSAVWNEFRVFTILSSSQWTEHCRGLVQAETDGEEASLMRHKLASDLDRGSRCPHETTPQKFYYLSREIGLGLAERI